MIVDEGEHTTVHGYEGKTPAIGESIKVGPEWVTVTKVEAPPADPQPVIHARRH